jgi:hypothetical protein
MSGAEEKHTVWVQKPEEKIPLGRSRHRKRYVRTNLQETGW